MFGCMCVCVRTRVHVCVSLRSQIYHILLLYYMDSGNILYEQSADYTQSDRCVRYSLRNCTSECVHGLHNILTVIHGTYTRTHMGRNNELKCWVTVYARPKYDNPERIFDHVLVFYTSMPMLDAVIATCCERIIHRKLRAAAWNKPDSKHILHFRI